ncbi:WNT6-like protein [Mya arenaria]|uniref:Protein Wnt n=1 Tax=Mya arenaria TaxID=6604 RepID=A0ABY7EJ35_MYAAR|nr:protein Wnt-6-like isoform X2 [Mya arenaria]WAR10008.1 WNT6-like protein [Mya arenaria]
MNIQAFYAFLYFYLMCPADIIGLWWAVGSPLVLEPNKICRKNRKLSGKQRYICRREKEIVEEAVNGARLAIAECQYQFQTRRWNCTTARKSFARILRRDTRETAFVYAITAAGVVYTVTRACSRGSLLQCTCDNNVRDITSDGEWEWGGCHDDVDFGYMKSKEFMDDRRKKKKGDLRTKIRLHNNEAGRLAIREYMTRDCKCHGLSGTCALRTCWRRMPNFRDTGTRLKDKFDGASKVTISNDGRSLVTEDDTIKPPSKEDLLYTEQSPNFCKPRKRYGSLGTQGRQCVPDSMGLEGCTLMCCGRGYTQTQVTVQENCKCQFIWCCQVICKTCTSIKTITRCL